MTAGEPSAALSAKQSSEVARKADDLLKAVDPGPFSPAAFSVLQGKVAQYVAEVARESAILAKRSQSDVISVRDVEAACERITMSPQKKLYRHLGTFAGLSLGACGSTLSSMVVAAQYPAWAIVLTLGTGLVGAFLLGIHMTKD